MADILLCNREDLMTRTAISGNIDLDKITPFIKSAQDIHIQGLLGTPLYDKILADVADDSLTGDYENLVLTFVKPVLIHYSISDFISFHAYSIENGGIYKHTADTGEVVSKDEVDSLVKKQRDIGDHYRGLLVKHLCNNMELYPEYGQSTTEGIHASKSQNGFTGWVL